MRNQFAKICADILKTDPKAVILLGDISHFLLRNAAQIAPERLINLGICEQSMVSIAAGLSMQGMKPIVHTIAPFVIERAYEQIKIDIGYQNTEVTIITVGGSYDYSDLGCTHHCYNDIALMRLIPNIEIYEPGTPIEFEQLFKKTWNNGKSKYFRLNNKNHNHIVQIEPGEIKLIQKSKNHKYVFTTGPLLDDVCLNTDIGIFYTPTLSHFNSASIEMVKSYNLTNFNTYCVENHNVIGGLGDLISETFQIKVNKLGIKNQFITEYGTYEQLKSYAGLDTKSILQFLNI